MSASYKYKLKPSLSETFRGIIWKIETDDSNTIVAVETRDVSERITYFSAFDYTSGKCLFKEITVEEGWFWSLDRVVDGMVFLHSYVNESNPEHKGIIAIDKAGDMAWQQYHKTLHDVTDKGILVYNPKIQPKLLELISPATGDLISAPAAPSFSVTRNILLPEILEETSSIKHLLPESIIGPAFYLSFGDKEILVFHTDKEKKICQQLVVYQHGNIVLEDILAEDIQKLNPEAFFIQNSHLFYIRNNKQEFVSYLV
ncbi:MAG: DUF4905 domain-containing protein [Sphingobacteriaceae bacterium]|nr:DUF4905 domain-containing protein [Sphingobacteriaceae bacterium]